MIEVVGLCKRFGALEVLKGVDLTAGAGRVTALVGPNGSGKTTLIKTILGLVRADAGVIRIAGRLPDADGRYRERLGCMPQLPRLPEHVTGREVLDLVESLRPGARRDRALIAALGLAASLDVPVRTLSGGTRQRLNAALAFLFDPEVLILDEPTAGLDPVASSVLKDHIRAARARGRTILLTSHVMAELEELSDDVAFLLEGTIRFRGDLDELLAGTGERTLERGIASLMREPAGAGVVRRRALELIS